jgi:hypothetical protein
MAVLGRWKVLTKQQKKTKGHDGPESLARNNCFTVLFLVCCPSISAQYLKFLMLLKNVFAKMKSKFCLENAENIWQYFIITLICLENVETIWQ